MKKYGFGLALSVCMVLISLGVAQAAQVVDRIVAVVNGDIITYQDLLQQIRILGGQTPDQTMIDNTGPQVLDSMIDDIVLRKEAERLKIEVSDAEVDNEIRQFKARRQMNEDDFQRNLRMQGLTPEQFKERSRQDIVKHKMLGYMVRRKVVVTQEEVDAYVSKHGAELASGTILALQLIVVVDADQAQALAASIKSGEISFSDAVQKYSVGPKAQNGTMNDVRLQELDEPWKVALRELKSGDVSKPFEIQGKWVVLKLLDRKDGTKQVQTAVEEEAREAIMRPKLEERFNEYMTGLRSKALIEKRL